MQNKINLITQREIVKLVSKLGLIILNVSLPLLLNARSALRPQDPFKPTLITSWENDTKTFSVKSDYLEPYPLFSIQTDNLMEDYLPMGEISFRNKENVVLGKDLSYLIQELLTEIKANKKTFTHFKVLQSKNYSFWNQCGLLVLKFNDYPFVVKLFMETPETFVNPYVKGAEPMFFWYMGGGAGRHIAGITRVKNLKNMKAKTQSHPYWHDHVLFPRKWIYIPNDAQWIHLTGLHLKKNEELTNTIPGTFAIIADYIETKNDFKMSAKDEQQMVMNYCNDMGMAVDPHHKNYSFQKHATKNEPVMVVVDTEHFPTMVGLKDPKEFEDHGAWYRFLANKGFNDIYMRTKKDRKQAMSKVHKLALLEIA